MGYSNIAHIEMIVAQALTSSTPSDLLTSVDLLKIGNTLDTNQIPQSNVDQYIAWGDSEIDSSLSSLYVTPLKEISDFETTLLTDIGPYNNYIITTDASPFYVGDSVVLTNCEITEKHIIGAIIDPVDMNVFETVEVIDFAFTAGTRVLRVTYPDPITITSARKAAANIYDKYFMSQSSPGQSDYGDLLRKLADQSLMDVLSGSIILHGQHRIGRGFYNPTLLRQYGLEGAQPGGRRGLERIK